MKLISSFFQKVFAWIWLSSANPTQVSLTVKSTLTAGAAVLLQVIGFTHINVGVADINVVINDVTTVVLIALELVAAVGAVVGAVQKIYLTVIGKNAVVTAQ